jgi:hypothetical protein
VLAGEHADDGSRTEVRGRPVEREVDLLGLVGVERERTPLDELAVDPKLDALYHGRLAGVRDVRGDGGVVDGQREVRHVEGRSVAQAVPTVGCLRCRRVRCVYCTVDRLTAGSMLIRERRSCRQHG